MKNTTLHLRIIQKQDITLATLLYLEQKLKIFQLYLEVQHHPLNQY